MSAERWTGDFGSTLRGARERRGVSLRAIANATKISVGVLEALERNDMSRLPGGIFSRAFVRSYAAEVGLDPERTVRDFIAAFPEEPVAAGHPAEPIEDGDAIESERRTATTVLQLVGLSIPVALGVWLFGMSVRQVPAPAAPPAAAEASATAPETAPAPGRAAEMREGTRPVAAPAASAPTVVPTSGPEPALPAANGDAAPPVPFEPAPSRRLTVTLSVTRPCWISLTVDGQRAIERLLRPGDERTVDVQREMVLTAGDAAAVALTINGVAARPLGRAGQVVTARFNPANVRDYLRTP